MWHNVLAACVCVCCSEGGALALLNMTRYLRPMSSRCCCCCSSVSVLLMRVVCTTTVVGDKGRNSCGACVCVCCGSCAKLLVCRCLQRRVLRRRIRNVKCEHSFVCVCKGFYVCIFVRVCMVMYLLYVRVRNKMDATVAGYCLE